MANKIVTPTADAGNVDFVADFDRGKVVVTVRAPLTIDKRTCELPVTDFLEIAAQITLASLQVAKAVRDKMVSNAGGPQPA